MTSTSNERLEDALIRHEIYLIRYAGHVAAGPKKKLDRLGDDIKDLLKKQEGVLPRRRIVSMMKEIAALSAAAWKEIDIELVKEALRFAKSELNYTQDAIKKVVPVILDLKRPTPDQLKAAVNKRLSGRKYTRWMRKINRDVRARLRSAIELGYIQGENSSVIADRIRAVTSDFGVHNLKSVIRTNNKKISYEIRKALYRKNKDILGKVRFLATLDSRTTIICAQYDGKVFDMGKEPRLPLHWGCRSEIVPVILAEPIGNRPAKPYIEKQILRDFNDTHDLPTNLTYKELTDEYKKMYKKYRNDYIDSLVGRVPAKTTYAEWFKRQPKYFQEDVLGRARTALYRKGGYTLDRFVDRRSGKKLTLKKLRKRDAAAFAEAGID